LKKDKMRYNKIKETLKETQKGATFTFSYLNKDVTVSGSLVLLYPIPKEPVVVLLGLPIVIEANNRALK